MEEAESSDHHLVCKCVNHKVHFCLRCCTYLSVKIHPEPECHRFCSVSLICYHNTFFFRQEISISNQQSLKCYKKMIRLGQDEFDSCVFCSFFLLCRQKLSSFTYLKNKTHRSISDTILRLEGNDLELCLGNYIAANKRGGYLPVWEKTRDRGQRTEDGMSASRWDPTAH